MKFFVIILLIVTTLGFFQNCGSEFSPLERDLKSSISNINNPSPPVPSLEEDSPIDSSNTDPTPAPSTPTFPENPVPASAVLETIATGHSFTEGPAYRASNNSLFFSDLGSLPNRIFVIDLATLNKSLWDGDSRAGNGNLFDSLDRLYTLRGRGLRAVTRSDQPGEVVGNFFEFPNDFENGKLAAPNDLVLHSDGSLFFTDPIFNTDDANNPNQLPFRGVFKYNKDQQLENVIRTGLTQPNGIAFSPDESILYISDSREKRVMKYSFTNGQASNPQLFYDQPLDERTNGNMDLGPPDGITVDQVGNLYISGGAKITILKPDGTRITAIEVGEDTTNCKFGGPENKTLFITGRTSVYRIKLHIPGYTPQVMGP